MLVIEQENKPKLKKSPKKARRQYSAGFRDFSIPKGHLTNSNSNFGQSVINNDIYSTLRSLNIGNLPQAYAASHPVVRTNPTKLIQESVLRLTKNQTRQKEQSQQQSFLSQEPKVKFQEVYSMNKDYENQAQRNLLLREKQKTQKILSKIFTDNPNIYHTFQDAFVQFLFCKADEFADSSCPLSIDDLKIQFKGFLLNATKKYNPPKIKDNVNIFQIESIAKRNLFIFCFIHYPELLKNNEKSLLQQIYQKIKLKRLYPTPQVLQKFYSKKQFTIPYDFHCTKPKQVQVKSQIPQPKHTIKANPIPKTLYQPPKQMHHHHEKATQCMPFSFDGKTTKKIAFEDYYHWDTSFKARQIPQSTYQPTNPLYDEQINKKYRQQRAKKLAQTSSFPTTMQYLDDYEGYKEQRNQKIVEKNQRVYSTQKIKNIPNFDKLHAKNMIELQQLKQQNRKNTKASPFKLHQTTKKVTINKPHQNIQFKKKKNNTIDLGKPIVQKPKSTKKFDEYTKFRKNIKDQKIKEQQKIKKQTKEKDKKNQHLKNILKDRVKQGIAESENKKRNQNYVPSNPIKQKLDLQDIYRGRPLLMETTQPKKGPSSFYSDTFTPII